MFEARVRIIADTNSAGLIAQAINDMVAAGVDINALHDFSTKSTLLHIAAGYNCVEAVEELLSLGALIDVKNVDGRPPLHDAARFGATTCLDLLLSSGADPHGACPRGRTALHEAAWNSHHQCVQSLLEYGAIFDQPDNEGSTPRSRSRYSEVISLLRSWEQRVKLEKRMASSSGEPASSRFRL